MKLKRNLIHLPIYFLFSILPIFVYAFPYNNHTLADLDWYKAATPSLDLFLKGKGYLFCILAIWFLILAIMAQRKRHKILPLEVFLIILYGLLCLLSYLFSDYKEIGFTGSIEQNETILVLLGYCILAYSFHILLQAYDLLPTICRALGIGTFFLILISLFQLFSHDLLQYSWVQALVVPAKLRETVGELTLQSDVNSYNRVYATLHNPNYFGVYGNLVVPMLIYAVCQEKRKWLRWLFVIEIPLLFLLLLASGSKTFLLVFFIQTVLAMLFLLFRGKKYIMPISIMLGIFGIIFIGYKIVFNYSAGNRFQTALSISPIERQLRQIQVQKNEILIHYGEDELHLSFSIEEFGGTIQVSDSDGVRYEYQIDQNGQYHFQDSRLDSVYFYAGKIEETYVCVAVIEDTSWYFTYLEQEERYTFLTPSGKEADIITAQTVLPGYERFASGRGYIWGRSIPLLKNNLLLGKGPETFLLQFPQNDYVAAVNAGYYNTVISRPHNAYLQIGIQTGVLSLLAYSFSFLIYVMRTGCSVWKKKRFLETDWIRVSIVISLIGYMICMLAHDSLVVTAPLYWALLGCGIGLNQREKSK